MPGNNFLWPKFLYSESSFSSGRAVHVAPWVVLSVCFLPVEFGVSDSPLLFHPPSLPFIPGSQCFCWCNILRYLWIFHARHRVHSVRQKPLPQIFPGSSHLYSWLLLRWLQVSRNQMSNLFKKPFVWLNTLTFGPSKDKENVPGTPFSPEHAFLTVNISTS